MNFTLEPASWPILAADLCWKATALLALAAGACWPLQRASASTRHLVWTLAMLGILVLPLLTLGLPTYRLPLLPTPNPGPLTAERGITSAAGREGAGAEIAGPKMLGAVRPSAASLGPEEPPPAARPRLEPPPQGAHSWGSWLVAIWAAGAALALAPVLAGLVRLGSPRVGPADGPGTELIEALRARLKIRRRVELLQGDEAAAPMTWGVWRPRVLVPRSAAAWPAGRLHDVLLHELAHVARWDCLTQTVAQVACAAYWFHPLAWLASHRMRAEREVACDDLVLRFGSRGSDYAGHLLALARSLRPPARFSGALPIVRPSQLEARLRSILDNARSHRGVSQRVAALALATTAAVVAPLSAARLGARSLAADGVTPPADDPAQMVVTGRVLDPTGTPTPGAQVAVVGRRKRSSGSVRARDQVEVLGRGATDPAGAFRLEVARTSALTFYEAHVLAGAPGRGFGLGWAELNCDAPAPTADVSLRPDRPVEGRLVDLQGEAASGVAIRISRVGVPKPALGRTDGLNFWQATPAGLDGLWPGPLTTDAGGHFRLSGVGREVQVGLSLDDPRYARQGLSIATEAGAGAKQVTLPIQPAMLVSGRVTAADTGEPIRDAILQIGAGEDPFNRSSSDYRTDNDGRFAANPAPGKYLYLVAYPPAGSPYLICGRTLEVGDATGRQVVDLAVPRGTLVSGTVRAAGGGPLAGASVYYEDGRSNIVDPGEQATIPGWLSAVTTGLDGRYAIAVAPGRGHLTVYGPAADYVHEIRSELELRGRKPGGNRYYAHAFVPYVAQAGTDQPATDIALKPGAVLTGTVVGPEGQAVDAAEIVTTLSISPFHTSWRGDFTLPVRAGRFEIHGVPTDRAVACSFLDSEHGWGATVLVDAALAARGPLPLRLQPCGTATARLVDEAGKPIGQGAPMFSIVGSPGHGTDFYGESLAAEERTELAADEETYANVDRRHYWQGPRSDAEGRIKLPCLIPGATYRVYEYTPERAKNAYRPRDFTVPAGQTLDLGDVRLKGSGN